MIRKPSRKVARDKRHYRIRNHIKGTPERPRLTVFRSNSHIYAQLIDDVAGHTLVSASTMEKDLKGTLKQTANKESAAKVGETIAKKALDKGINTVVFDRSGYIYHGKIKALADAAREGGLKF